jgi:gliding motility-associated-like protein
LVATSDKSCKDSIIREVTVYPQPAIPTITGKSIVCEGTPTILTTSGGTTYQWLLNNNPISGAVNATIGATQAGVYVVDAISDKGCKSRSANPIALELVQKPQSNFTYNSSCTKVPMVLTSTSSTGNSGVVQYTWNLGYGISGTGQSISYTFSNPLTVNAKLVVTPMGCPQLSDSIVKSIVVENAPISIKYPDVNAVENKPLQLQARTFGVLYSWSPSTYLSSASVSNPKYTGIREQLYKISIKNSAGCNTVDTQMVKVFKDRDIYVPTGFTPDNDGHNDRLYPIVVGMKQLNVFKVFNRWGVMVYDNKAANISTGWDGYYKNKQQPMDTYAWIAEGIDDDGNVLKKSGNVVLIR